MYELSQPWVLVLLWLPWFIYKWVPPVHFEYQVALRVPFFKNFCGDATLLQQQKCLWFWHWVGIWVLMVFALSGPRWVSPPQAFPESLRNIMLVLDISGSMGLKDMQYGSHLTSRWSIVKQTALSFVTKRSQDKIGLILFGEHPYLFAPLTYDQSILKQRIQDASVGLAGQATALGDAMGLAIKHLQTSRRQGRIMILLTDGVTNAGMVAPLKAAEYAAKENIKIYAIGLGPNPRNQGISSIFWQLQHVADLDEDSLKKIAAITHGQYYRATDMNSLVNIYQAIEKLEPVIENRDNLRLEKQYYYFPLGIAFIWILSLFGVQMYRDGRT